ncbi:MAG: HesA/MoeB/ThiF family protein [Pseudomonadales bacterium]
MNDEQLLKYSRHLMLPDLDVAGQEQLLAAHVVVMGLGGLGSPVALYLAASGVGKLTLVDPDVVDHSNLQRQIAHGHADIGAAKVESAAGRIRALNLDTDLQLIERSLKDEELMTLFADASVVVDGTDSFRSRYAINAAAWRAGIPLVSGAAIRWEGQVAAFDPRSAESPCYQCLYPDTGAEGGENCAENGIVSPLVGVIGSMQALEALKLICGVGENLVGKVSYYDAKYAEWRQFSLTRFPQCPICAS